MSYLAGNVWEWTSDYYSPNGAGAESTANACCGPPANPRVQSPDGEN